MEFRIADTFTASLARLTAQEQKSVKTTAFDLQTNPTNAGLRFHRLDKMKDPNFWSVSASMDIRLIVHKTASSILLCYVDHHDKAYAWAQSRKVETHPTTGAAQLVEIRETVKEITIPKYTEVKAVRPPKPLLFSGKPDDELLGYGVPLEWLQDVKTADEDSILEIADHLPGEAAEALLELAIGGTPQLSTTAGTAADPFEHPDAKRRFRVIDNIEELQQALEFPWEKWAVFLHPEQRHLVEMDFRGPARVSGSAGTGKTIVALHRAVHLAKTNEHARVLLTTFSEPLANALRNKLKVLLKHSPRLGDQIEVYPIDEIGQRLYKLNIGLFKLASDTDIKAAIDNATTEAPDHGFRPHFIFSEWQNVVDAWQLKTWDAYRDVLRIGRKTRLPENKREVLWKMFEHVNTILQEKGLITSAELFSTLAQKMTEIKPPFEFTVIDEAQDISISQLRFLAALEGDRNNSLFFSGDLGQRIFQQPFSWKALGVDIQGRSRTLKINYRTSHQIRMQADLLLGPELSDVDGNTEERRGTVSVFNGPKPDIFIASTENDEAKHIVHWISRHLNEDVKPHEIGIFVRSENEITRAQSMLNKARIFHKILDEVVDITSGHVSIGTMHLAKGLEFRAVAVMACDDEIIPSQERIENISDEAELEDVYNTERHLLYVACTRARDFLLVSGVGPVSEFVDDMQSQF